MPFRWPWASPEPSKEEKLVRQIGHEIAEEILRRTESELRGLKEARQLHDRVTELKKQIEDLTLQKDRKQEEFDRREREIQHKLGLHKSQVEHETQAAIKEAELNVREGNLDKDQKRFEEQMKFHKAQLEAQIQQVERVLNQVLKRLPSAAFTADLGEVVRAGKGGKGD